MKELEQRLRVISPRSGCGRLNTNLMEAIPNDKGTAKSSGGAVG